MKLSSNVSIEPAKVHLGSSKFIGKDATVIGAGLLNSRPRRGPERLQKVNTPILSNTACNDLYDDVIGARVITPLMMCAGFENNAKGSCNGDSGGPLFSDIQGERVIVGTVSFGLSICEEQRGTSAYARLSMMEDFLREHSPITAYVNSSLPPIGAFLLLLGE